MNQLKIDYEQKYKAILESSYVDPLGNVSQPPLALSYGNSIGYNPTPTGIASYGNFSFVQAPPKSKKTFFLSLIAASYIGGKTERTGDMIGYRKGKKLIHYDTEQSTFHAQKVFRRVYDICGTAEDYYTYALRQYSAPERLDFIDWHLYNTDNIGLVIIDGIADLVLDSNDLIQSSKLVQYLMKWTQELNIHIITAIHSNWNSEKPTGHLGSFLEKKAETQIALELTSDKSVAVAKCKRSRGYSFDDFAFQVDPKGLPFILESIPDQIDKDKYIKI
jgi:hypothetical protein